MVRKEFKTINEIANEVIDGLKKVDNPFESPILVFHNTKIAQWFKTYYLKEHEEVMMNVRFMTLSVFLNGLINPKEEHKIVSRPEVRDYIVKVLLSKCAFDAANPEKPTNYIYKADGSVNGINLYEFADRLSSLFMNYEYDSEEMDTWTDGKWEKDIYDEVIKLAKADNCFTTRSLFDFVKGSKKFSDVRENLTDKVYIIDNSYITNLYNEILDAFNSPNVSVFSIEDVDKTYECEEVLSAPSVLREVEAVHSKICKIVHDNPKARFNDIVVYIPSMDDYANTVNQVFKQDDKEYPAIPYRIVGASKEQQDMICSLNILFEIANNRFFTRRDFNAFVKNPMVKYIWDISDEEIDSWMNAIDATNTFRNGKEYNDWNYLKKRLLLSKLVSNDSDIDNKTKIGSGDDYYLPYQSIDLDFDSVNKLIDIIDALLGWSNSFTDVLNNITLSRSDILGKVELLDALYSKKGEDGEESNYLYRTVLEEIEKVVAMSIDLPANTWLKMLIDSPNRYVSHPADMFAGGVTFMTLNSDNIVAEPYVFVMGLSSKAFPRVSIHSEIDYSKKHELSKVLDRRAIKNICLGTGHCICSFVGKDLKKDTECYPSEYMPKVIGGKGFTQIPLDEIRDYAELYTKKEFVNKAYYKGLVGGTPSSLSKSAKRSVAGIPENLDSVLNITDIKNYLDNTFVYKYNHLLQKNDDMDETICNEYEPVDAGSLTKYNVVKDLINSDATLPEQMVSTQLTKALPEQVLGNIYLEEYSNTADFVKEIISKGGYSYKALTPLELNTLKGTDTIKWTLNCNTDMYVKEDGNELSYIEPIDGHEWAKENNVKTKYFLNAYVYSLMDIVQNHNDEKEYIVNLNVGAHRKTYQTTPAEANEILGKLYDYMTNYQDTRYMDSEILKDIKDEMDAGNIDDSKKIPKTFSKFKDKIENDSKWKYFADSKMIDVYQAFGYGNNIKKELLDMADMILPCVKFLG